MVNKETKQSRISRLFGIKVKSKLAAAYLDTAVKILICVVCGALFLMGIYGVIQKVVLPKTETAVVSMFSYEDEADGGAGGAGGSGGVEAPDVNEGPTMLDGDGQTFNSNTSTQPLSFRSSAPINTFQEVKVDGNTVAESNYAVTEGSTIITFTDEYAKTLSNGNHSIDIVSSVGTASCEFTSTNPFTSLITKTWNDFTPSASGIWTDGTNIYYSGGSHQYILNGDTWETKTWNGLTSFSASGIWTDGTNIYYSSGSNQYVLNGDTWETKTWNGLTNLAGSKVWSDGNNYYYSYNNNQYVLNGDTWEPKTWNGLTSFHGDGIWTDGTNIYYSFGSTKQYVLNEDTWEAKDWSECIPQYAQDIWTDGTNIYYSYYNEQYILNNGVWESKDWSGLISYCGSYVWTDGKNYYVEQIEMDYETYEEIYTPYVFS